MKSMVLAIGGNSLVRPGERGTFSEQLANARRIAAQVVRLIRDGYRIVLTHGNGPQVGAELLLSERAAGQVPCHPLDICDASTQGEMGYLLQQALSSEMKLAGVHAPVVAVVTQCVVSLDDPAMRHPTKPVGPFYTEAEAERRRQQLGWQVVEDANRGYRRVVPSPRPLEILELEVIRHLVQFGALVIACGGGGIPVAWVNDNLVGVEAVIDKDLASALLASKLGAELFLIGTDTDFVYLNYKKPLQQPLRRIGSARLAEYARAGHFPPGSMGPKIEAVLEFLRGGGREAIITSCDHLCEALEGTCGTHVVPGREAFQPEVSDEGQLVTK
jgi:carbamate kinase